jgi:hypothetical protein
MNTGAIAPPPADDISLHPILQTTNDDSRVNGTAALSPQCRALLFWILWFEDHKRFMAELREKQREARRVKRQQAAAESGDSE